ncbi:MCE family protein [soil metagenome]
MTSRSSPRPRAAIVAVFALLVFAPLAGGCSLFGDDDRISAEATFSDVADLAPSAPVQLADVQIGNVTGIELDDTGTRATITMAVDESAQVPRAVLAKVRRTTPLGEKFIELMPLVDDLDAPLLADDDVITATEVVPDLEQLVASGTDLFGALSASQLAILIDEGATGFGGRGAQIRQVLENLDTITAGYATRTQTITELVGSLDQLAADLAPSADANVEALANLADTTRILDEESTELLDMIDSLNRLADAGSDILQTHLVRINTQIDALRSVTRAVAGEQAALGELLEFTPGHNDTLSRSVVGDFVQVLNDFIICGLPSGGEIDGDPVNDCDGGAGGGAP